MNPWRKAGTCPHGILGLVHMVGGGRLANLNSFIAVDIGTSKVSTVIAHVGSRGNLKILGAGVAPSCGITKGRIVEPVQARESVRTSLESATHDLGLGSLAGAYVGASGDGIFSDNARYTFTLEPDWEHLSNGRLKELATSSVPESEYGRLLLHLIPTGYHREGFTYRARIPVVEEDLPRQEEVECHRILGDSGDLNETIKAVQGCGIDVKCLVSQGLAAAEATLTTFEKEQGVVLVDVGGGTMDLVIYRRGLPWYTCIIPVGGNQATNDISLLMDLPANLSEEIMVKWGSVMPEMIRPEEEVVVSDCQRNLQRAVNRRAVAMLLQARFEEILKLIALKVRESGSPAFPAGGLVITGGFANLHGVKELGEKTLRGPVRIGHPAELSGLGLHWEKPQFSAAVGLLLWGIRNHGEDRKYGKPPSPPSRRRLFWGRKSSGKADRREEAAAVGQFR